MSYLRVLFFAFGVLWTNVSGAVFSTKYYTESLQACEGKLWAASFGPHFCNLASYLKKNVLPLQDSAEVFSGERLVLLGDTHPHKLLKEWLARNLASLKASGFTHVGLEALNSESQELLDRYKTNPLLQDQVLKLIQKDWGWIPEEHLALIDAIHSSGLKLVTLDNRNELAQKGRSDKIQLRNEHMAQIITSTLNDSQTGRFIVLTGKVHSALISEDAGVLTLPEVLKSRGVPVLSVDLESGEALVPRPLTQAFVQYLIQNTLPSSLSGDYFLPTPVGTASHGIIFITK